MTANTIYDQVTEFLKTLVEDWNAVKIKVEERLDHMARVEAQTLNWSGLNKTVSVNQAGG